MITEYMGGLPRALYVRYTLLGTPLPSPETMFLQILSPETMFLQIFSPETKMDPSIDLAVRHGAK